MRLYDNIDSCPDNKEILHSNVLVIIGIRNVMSMKDGCLRCCRKLSPICQQNSEASKDVLNDMTC